MPLKQLDRRTVVAAACILFQPAFAAQPQPQPPLFLLQQLDADPAALLNFVSANEGRVVRLDARLPREPARRGVRYVFLRDGDFLVVIDERGWLPKGAMLFLAEDGIRRSDHFHFHRSYSVSRHRSFEGPSFRSIPDLPPLFRGYHVDPFA